MKLKNLILTFGKAKINTLIKYPSILTLHKMAEKGKLSQELTTDLVGEKMYATEKIDGTNVRLIRLGKELLIGSREFILHYDGEMFFDPAQHIVEGIKNLALNIPETDVLTVFYGEFYGGKTGANAKQYGTDKVDFRLFDVAKFDDLSILEQDLDLISRWRETETPEGMRYGQPFLPKNEFEKYATYFELAPQIAFDLENFTHKNILKQLHTFLPETKVALSELALKRPEGVIFRNENRSKIVKLRFEDYERTLR